MAKLDANSANLLANWLANLPANSICLDTLLELGQWN
jgi:hypothetical protein